jgi:hypothetical protein
MVGTFRVVRADDLLPVRSSRDAWSGQPRWLAEQGLVVRTREGNCFRALRECFRAASFDTAYTGWLERGDVALAGADGAPQGPGRSVGRLRIEKLPFDYTQFGSLPGVA